MRSLAVRELTVSAGARVLVHGVDWRVQAGELMGLTGPSGGGKTVIARASVGLLDAEPGVTRGQLELDSDHGLETWTLVRPSRAADQSLSAIRGRVATYLPQNADQCLDPLRSVGAQVRSAAGGGRPEPWLTQAGFEEPTPLLRRYPHTLSGGMARRVAIAMALARGSGFLLADEPTTGLDALAADRVASTLRRIADTGVGVLWITHDIHRLRALADGALVVAEGRVDEVLDRATLSTGTPVRETARTLLSASGGDW